MEHILFEVIKKHRFSENSYIFFKQNHKTKPQIKATEKIILNLLEELFRF